MIRAILLTLAGALAVALVTVGLYLVVAVPTRERFGIYLVASAVVGFGLIYAGEEHFR